MKDIERLTVSPYTGIEGCNILCHSTLVHAALVLPRPLCASATSAESAPRWAHPKPQLLMRALLLHHHLLSTFAFRKCKAIQKSTFKCHCRASERSRIAQFLKLPLLACIHMHYCLVKVWGMSRVGDTAETLTQRLICKLSCLFPDRGCCAVKPLQHPKSSRVWGMFRGELCTILDCQVSIALQKCPLYYPLTSCCM